MKNCKAFHEAQIASHLRKLFDLSPGQSLTGFDLTTSQDQNFLTEMDRNI